MKKTSLVVLVSLAALAGGVAHAEESSQIRTITDPGQIAAIEQHAQELQQHPEAAPVAAPEEHHERARHERRHHVKKHKDAK